MLTAYQLMWRQGRRAVYRFQLATVRLAERQRALLVSAIANALAPLAVLAACWEHDGLWLWVTQQDS